MTVAMSRGLLVALVILWISPYSLSHSYYMRWNAKSQAFFVYPQQAGSPLGIRSTEGASCCFGGTMEWFRSLIYNFSICTPAQKVKRAATDFVSRRLVILNAKEQIPRRMTGTRSIAFIFLPSTELKHNRNGVKWCGSTDT